MLRQEALGRRRHGLYAGREPLPYVAGRTAVCVAVWRYPTNKIHTFPVCNPLSNLEFSLFSTPPEAR